MIGSRPEPKPVPVPVRRYRYSKLRWRVLVHVLDAVGAVVMAIAGRFRRASVVASPRSILLVQLDHMGDAVLTSPMLPRLRAAYPEARIDVLASPSNRAVFAADPHVNRVLVAEKNWFARGPAGRALGSAVWRLGRSLRAERYDLGIDVRGDVLTVLVLALAGVRRRVGWAMGGGGFLLTDVAEWRPGRHEVRSRMALLDCLGLPEIGPPRVGVGVDDDDRSRVATMLAEAWPERGRSRGRAVMASVRHGAARGVATRVRGRAEVAVDADALHAGRFGEGAPILAVHLGGGDAGEAVADPALAGARGPLPQRRLARGARGRPRRRGPRLQPGRARGASRLDGAPGGDGDRRSPGACRFVHRFGLWPGAPGGLRRGAVGRALQRHEPGGPMAALVAPLAGDARAGAVPPVPPQGLPPGRSSVPGRPVAGACSSGGAVVVVSAARSGVPSCADLMSGSRRGGSLPTGWRSPHWHGRWVLGSRMGK